jgi:hypothetical protein
VQEVGEDHVISSRQTHLTDHLHDIVPAELRSSNLCSSQPSLLYQGALSAGKDSGKSPRTFPGEGRGHVTVYEWNYQQCDKGEPANRQFGECINRPFPSGDPNWPDSPTVAQIRAENFTITGDGDPIKGFIIKGWSLPGCQSEDNANTPRWSVNAVPKDGGWIVPCGFHNVVQSYAIEAQMCDCSDDKDGSNLPSEQKLGQGVRQNACIH